MKKGLVDLAKYKEIIEIKRENDDYTLRGAQGFCFIEGEEIIKIYNDLNENKDKLSDYSSERISFPYYYIENNDAVYGEVMPYFDAKEIGVSVTKNSLIGNLISHYKKIRKEVINFSDISMNDLSYPNILYDEEKGFYLIDTTSWFKWSDEKRNRLFNLKNLDKGILVILRSFIFEYETKKELRDIMDYYKGIKNFPMGRELLKLMEMNLEGYEPRFLEFMEAYREIVKIYYNDEVKTVEDAKKYTKIMKNNWFL